MRDLLRELLLVLSRKLKVSVSLLQMRELTTGASFTCSRFFKKDGFMENLKIYEVDPAYIDYLSPYSPHLFLNKKPGQKNERKYIGIVLHINGFEYFAPLSSFKEKHRRMNETVDFIKIKNYAVINLNNMFPVPKEARTYVDISLIQGIQYKSLLLSEYRYIKSIQDKICKNARSVYTIKLRDGNSSPLAKRCNNFGQLEKCCSDYKG